MTVVPWREVCACGGGLVECVKCGDPRCLRCDPYDGSDDCVDDNAPARTPAKAARAGASTGGF